MARIYDRLRATSAVPEAQRSLRRATVLLAAAVSQYYCAGTAKEVWDPASDVPTLAPLSPTTFVDFLAPALIVSETRGLLPWVEFTSIRAWGVLFLAHDLAQMTPEQLATYARNKLGLHDDHLRELGLSSRDMATPATLARAAGYRRLAPEQRATLAPLVLDVRFLQAAATREGAARLQTALAAGRAPRWAVQALLVAEEAHGEPLPLWQWDYRVLPSGAMARLPDGSWAVSHPAGGMVATPTAALPNAAALDQLYHTARSLLTPALLAVAYGHELATLTPVAAQPPTYRVALPVHVR
ncbi:MAG: hypothetical protein NVSMB65_17260 [Chloroflexota bacterium]